MGKLCKGVGSGAVNFVIIAGPVALIVGMTTLFWSTNKYKLGDEWFQKVASALYPILWGFFLVSLVLMIARLILIFSGRSVFKTTDPVSVEIPSLSGHRVASFFWIAASALFIPVILVVGFFTLFTLAFLDYIPPGMTFLDWLASPIGTFLSMFLASLSVPIYACARTFCLAVRCQVLDESARNRMNAVREKCAAFYEEHGRSPSAEDQIELGADSNDFSFVVLTGEEARAGLEGKPVVVASTAPWKSAFGWHGVVLREDGEIELMREYSYVRDFYRSVNRILTKRREARERNV